MKATDENIKCGSFHCRGGHKWITNNKGNEQLDFIDCGAHNQSRYCQFIGDCASNPFPTVQELTKVIERGSEISFKTFITYCDLAPPEVESMNDYPNDYRFYLSHHNGKRVFYYEWSRIEHFYQ